MLSNLFPFTKNLLSLCLKLLDIEKSVIFTETYQKVPEKGIIDLRSTIHPKNPVPPSSLFNPQPYIQLFGNEFVPNMSVVDLLFCEGPNARNIIAQSTPIT